MFNSRALRGPRGLKLFLIQRLRGLILLLIILQVNRDIQLFTQTVASLLVVLKIGGFPFHHWLVSLGVTLRWDTLAFILTLQKILPLYFLAHIGGRGLILLRGASWIVVSFRRRLVKTPKKLYIFSSVFFLGAVLITPILRGGGWKKLLFIYCFIFYSIAFLRGGEKELSLTRGLGRRGEIKLLWLGVILIIRGVPPLPGFYLKLEIVSLIWARKEIIVLQFFLLGTALFLFIYVSLILGLISRTEKLKPSRMKRGLRLGLICLPIGVLFIML